MRHIEMQNYHSDGHVFMFPARAPEVQGHRISYLFSVRQVAEVLNHAAVQPVPFAPTFAEGVTQWRGRVLPVLSLEHCLGITISDEPMHLRSIVVRSISGDDVENLQEVYTVFKVGAAIRQLELPLACAPTHIPDWIADPSVLSGAYESDDELFLVVNLKTILATKRPVERYVS